jgi:hypothetical protein
LTSPIQACSIGIERRGINTQNFSLSGWPLPGPLIGSLTPPPVTGHQLSLTCLCISTQVLLDPEMKPCPWHFGPLLEMHSLSSHQALRRPRGLRLTLIWVAGLGPQFTKFLVLGQAPASVTVVPSRINYGYFQNISSLRERMPL